jgi:hypothetical protein
MTRDRDPRTIRASVFTPYVASTKLTAAVPLRSKKLVRRGIHQIWENMTQQKTISGLPLKYLKYPNFAAIFVSKSFSKQTRKEVPQPRGSGRRFPAVCLDPSRPRDLKSRLRAGRDSGPPGFTFGQLRCDYLVYLFKGDRFDRAYFDL